MMNRAASVFLGLLIIPVSCEFPPGSCDGYTNITDTWRNRNFTLRSYSDFPNDDAALVNKWLRFTGIGGDRVLTTCLTYYHGGTMYPIHVPLELPTNESVTPTQGIAYVYYSSCTGTTFLINVVLCPGGFYLYQPLSHPTPSTGYVTYHFNCQPDSCGPLAQCTAHGGCVCIRGYEIPSDHKPTNESYGCIDIDECLDKEICGPDSICANTEGSYTCTCNQGFEVTDPALPINATNICKDTDECLEDVCGEGTCLNNPGSFACKCNRGYYNLLDATPVCQDTDECFNSTVCGPDSVCTNTPGAYTCGCAVGYQPTIRSAPPNETNICIDVDECIEHRGICGPYSNCTNSLGSYSCTCLSGFRLNRPDIIASVNNPCTDIDECSETPGLCGKQTVCTNALGTFYCSCPDDFFPSTGIVWTMGITYCRALQDILDEIEPPEGQTKESAFLGNMDQQLKNNSNMVLPDATVANSFFAAMEVSGVKPRGRSAGLSSAGDGKTGTVILGIAESLITTMLPPNENQTVKEVQTPTVDLSMQEFRPGRRFNNSNSLSTKGQLMEINLEALAEANNGSATAAFMTLTGMESLLSHQYFQTENKTEMYSDVFTVILPKMNNTNLTEPVNFTIQHKEKMPSYGMPTCVYWEGKTATSEDDKGGNEEETLRWSVDGCWVTYTDENTTVCSCSHLSTFALIMQIGEPAPKDDFLEWLNRMCVIVGLFFFALAVLSFVLCSWNPKINNTARLHLCLSLGMSHLLLLWSDEYIAHERACVAMAGILHFLIVASFVWMLLEAIQLYLLVRRLTKVQVIQRDGLPRPLLYAIGYGVPFVIVGVSALIYSEGYGPIEGDACWLSSERNFNWALTGPVITILGMNCMLFAATLWGLRPTLASMKSDVSQSKDTRLIIFKIVAQFVILGCTWILGLYQSNLFFQILFIFLNSQQGTFLFIVHCLLNKEVRAEYVRWLTCSCKKERTVEKDVPSVSEDLDKPEEAKNGGRKVD